MLKEWIKSVRKDLSKKCVSNIISLGDVAQVINDIQEKVVRVLEQLRDTKNSNEELKENVYKFELMITEMHSVIVDNHCPKNV